ncbi:MAG: secretin N-terminal domain-containing protein [Hyphomonas oceanitis]
MTVDLKTVQRASAAALLVGAAAFLLVLPGCSHTSSRRPEPMTGQIGVDPVNPYKATEVNGALVFPGNGPRASDTSVGSEEFSVPSIANSSDPAAPGAGSRPPAPHTKTVDAAVQELPLPDFIDTVFGQMLQVPYYTGPGVAERKDVIIKLRTSGELKSADFLALVSGALAEYGVSVVAEDGVYKVLDDASLRGRMPRFVRSRTAPDTPSALRPLVMFVELDAISAADMATILKQAFPDKSRLTIEPNQAINVLTLNGLPEDVDAALKIIDEMDELAYAGTELLRYSPEYVGAKELAEQMAKLLTIEGWQSSSNPSIQRTIVTIPVEFTNDLFVFSKSPVALERARFWLKELDKPAKTGDVDQLFVYTVQNVDAGTLADTVNAVLSGGRSSPRRSASPQDADGQFQSAQGVSTGSTTATSLSGGNIPGSLVVDVISNRLIYSGAPSDYARLKPLLEQLDRPPGEVLILVTIAEITLTDETKYGLEFFVDSIGNKDFRATSGTSGLGLGSSGLNVGIFSGNVEVAINALASNSQVNVLSKPKLIARSGGAARLQVGTDVPVITSQRAASAQDGDGVTDVLQQVEYRKTGVLMSIEPIIFSDNRVDLTISQEVSTALPNNASSIASPTISNRTLDTQLSVKDGETVVLGGLIQNTTTDGETGIPILKDVPVAGNLFKNNSISQTRTELLILITAYILNDTNEKSGFTDRLVNELERTSKATDNMTTLLRPRPQAQPEAASQP